MRILFRAFAFLDLISLVFIAMQLWVVIKKFSDFTLMSDKVQGVLMFPMFILVLIGGYGLFFLKKIGFISYYIQFPFRLYLWVFTLGFITLFPEALGNYDDKWFSILFKVCFVAEFIRLFLTVRTHYQLKAQ